MSLYGVGTVVTSTAVPMTNSTVGQAMFPPPFIIRRTEGWIAHTTTTIVDSAGPHVVAVTGHTTVRPMA